MPDDRNAAPGPPFPQDAGARQIDAGQIDSHQIGRIGETLARAHLAAQGYRIIAANYRCRWGEIDLIARDGATWVFAEVRTRRSAAYGLPEESVTPAKLTRIVQTAEDYLTKHIPEPGAASDAHWRIDLIAIQLGPGRRVQAINHLPNIAAA